MPVVELQAFCPERDVSRIAIWLHHPQVARWWGPPPSILAEIVAHPADRAALIVADQQPVGYLCWQSPPRAELEAAGLADLPDDLIDIDLMIGEPAMQGRGIGPEALRLLFERLRRQGVALVGVATALANRRALRAFAKAQLQPYRDFVEQSEDYRYLTRWLNDPAPPGRDPQ